MIQPFTGKDLEHALQVYNSTYKRKYSSYSWFIKSCFSVKLDVDISSNGFNNYLHRYLKAHIRWSNNRMQNILYKNAKSGYFSEVLLFAVTLGILDLDVFKEFSCRCKFPLCEDMDSEINKAASFESIPAEYRDPDTDKEEVTYQCMNALYENFYDDSADRLFSLYMTKKDCWLDQYD